MHEPFIIQLDLHINTYMKYSEITSNLALEKFLEICRQELELESLPEIHFVDQDSMSGTAFGEYDGAVRVVSNGRHTLDVFRTLAHELVHWKQSQTGQTLDGSDGSDTENEANAVAGIIMRRVGRQFPHLFS